MQRLRLGVRDFASASHCGAMGRWIDGICGFACTSDGAFGR